ncbi:Hypothetical protein PHPALM_18847 [Phytophthora palmivora]|uniref:Sulfur globule protein CV3 domain protein n=1 Tax=Phytophthora palmivora TaxID=4796 RepID=A0A2P4XIR4_9STRA|nr:Hypothetical protein PHPALM_18847 [Phytophthora palmivora]
MIKRSIFAILLVLMALMTFTYADDATPNNLEDGPPGVTMVGNQEPVPSKEQFIVGGRRWFRHRFMFPYGGGFRYGWRYPIGYWNTFGRPIYGPSCLFGRPFGGYFYC